MRLHLTRLVTLLVVSVSIGFASSAAADGLLKATLVGSDPLVPIGGVDSGGLPWVSDGKVLLADDGRLKVDIRGLILPDFGNAGPVTHVAASLVCTGVGGAAVVATTGAAPLSPAGDGKILATLTLPGKCFGPIVLVRAAGLNGVLLPAPGPWIAASGF